MDYSELKVEAFTQNLLEYSRITNEASKSIANALQPIGLIVLAIFFVVELLNWKHFLNRNEKKVSTSLLIEFAAKYLIGLVLIALTPAILDSIMDISIRITKTINNIYPPSSYAIQYSDADIDGYFTRNIVNGFGKILSKITNIVVYALIFIRYVDLYFLKAFAPIMVGFFYSDTFRPTVMNFFKQFIAYSLLGATLLILSIIFGKLIESQLVDSVEAEPLTISLLTITKGVVYLIIIIGSIKKVKSLVGAN